MKNDRITITRCAVCHRCTEEVQYFSKRQLKRAASGGTARCSECIQRDNDDGEINKRNKKMNTDTVALKQRNKNIDKKNAGGITKDDDVATRHLPTKISILPVKPDHEEAEDEAASLSSSSSSSSCSSSTSSSSSSDSSSSSSSSSNSTHIDSLDNINQPDDKRNKGNTLNLDAKNQESSSSSSSSSSGSSSNSMSSSSSSSSSSSNKSSLIDDSNSNPSSAEIITKVSSVKTNNSNQRCQINNAVDKEEILYQTNDTNDTEVGALLSSKRNSDEPTVIKGSMLSSQTNKSTTSITMNRKRRLVRKTIYNDNDSDIYGEEETETVDTKIRKKSKKSKNDHDDDVKLDDLKFSILGRKLENNVEMSLQDHLDYYKNNHNNNTNNCNRNKEGITTTATTTTPIPTTNNTNDSNVVSSQNLETLKRDLTCVICHDVLFEPLSLSCGHSYCSDCLSWWALSSLSTPSSSGVNDNHLKCPTCRTQINDRAGLKSLRVNTCLRAGVLGLFPEELRARLALRKKATSGENDGSHSRGYEVVTSLQESPKRVIFSKNDRNDNNGVSVKRSVVIDSNDQRNCLALAVYGSIQNAVQGDDQHQDDDKINKIKKVVVTLCLLHMEEDEAEEGIQFLVHPNEDDEVFITKENRFSSLVNLSLLSPNGHTSPMSRRHLSSDGTVVFSFLLDNNKHSSMFLFHHDETGLQLVLELSQNEVKESSIDVRSRNVQTYFSCEEESTCTDNSSESEDNKFVYGIGGRDIGEYKQDGFIEFDGEDTMSHDVCSLCGQGGELLICDGGSHSKGCRRTFHIGCLGLDAIPDGDWICSPCGDTLGLGAKNKLGHEFSVKNTKDKEDADESDDCEFGMADEGRNSYNEGRERKRHVSKRRIILDSDDEDE